MKLQKTNLKANEGAEKNYDRIITGKRTSVRMRKNEQKRNKLQQTNLKANEGAERNYNRTNTGKRA